MIKLAVLLMVLGGGGWVLSTREWTLKGPGDWREGGWYSSAQACEAAAMDAGVEASRRFPITENFEWRCSND